MPNAMVRVVAHFAVRPDKIEEFIRLACASLVAPTRREPGCVEYDLCQDISDPTRFAMVEAWESAAALDAHLAQPALREAVARLGPMAAEPPKVHRLHSVLGDGG
jgi:quinol monooxygenase YgiN